MSEYLQGAGSQLMVILWASSFSILRTKAIEIAGELDHRVTPA